MIPSIQSVLLSLVPPRSRDRRLWNPGVLGLAAVLYGSAAFSAPVATPAFSPDGSRGPGVIKVTVRCATPQAEIHVTYDGREPTRRDEEVDEESAVLIDEPLVLKAKAWLPDGSVSATKMANFPLEPIPENASSVISQAIPDIMAAGQVYSVRVTMRNIGTQEWRPGPYQLAPVKPKASETWPIAPVALQQPTGTWKDASFRFQVTAPSEPGTYSVRLRLAADGKPFGEVTPTVRVLVLNAQEYEREIRVLGGTSSASRDGTDRPSAARVAPEPLGEQLKIALARAKARADKPTGELLVSLVTELQRSPRSFRYLRSKGFSMSDDAFSQIVRVYPELFNSVRIIRRDEQGKRVIPGWPGMTLVRR